jgi:hypothetical protein
MASLTPVIASNPINPNVGWNNSWIAVNNDQNRALFAQTGYIVNLQETNKALNSLIVNEPNSNGFIVIDDKIKHDGNFQSIKVLSACKISGLTAINTTTGRLPVYELPVGFEFKTEIRNITLCYGAVIAYNSADSYPSTIQQTYPNALLSETFGSKTINFIQSEFGYTPDNIVVAESICSDDVDAPKFIGNIGQFPVSMSSYLGAFMGGGLAGYPHTGITGLVAWLTHTTTALSGALFLYAAPHIGITFDGDVGFMKRRGQGGLLSSTCGAVDLAISTVVASNAIDPNTSFAFSVKDDYQQFTLTNILWNNRSTLLATAPADRMRVATEIIRSAIQSWVETNLPAAYAIAASVGFAPDVYFCSGTFINTDDGYDAYVDVSSFAKYNSSGWVDYTTAFKNTLL